MNGNVDEMIVPVMVWIHGGGFTFGHKNQDGNPYGFFNASTFPEDSEPIHDSIIFVRLPPCPLSFTLKLTTPGNYKLPPRRLRFPLHPLKPLRKPTNSQRRPL